MNSMTSRNYGIMKSKNRTVVVEDADGNDQYWEPCPRLRVIGALVGQDEHEDGIWYRVQLAEGRGIKGVGKDMRLRLALASMEDTVLLFQILLYMYSMEWRFRSCG
jgi:hypothetical protein